MCVCERERERKREKEKRQGEEYMEVGEERLR